MDNIYFSATNLYLVKPSVMTYDADNYVKLEQRIEDIDIAFKEGKRYFSIIDKREYIPYNNDIDFNKYYINVNDEDKILLIRYLYENDELLTDEEINHIQSIIKYFELNELKKFLKETKEQEDIIQIQKIKK